MDAPGVHGMGLQGQAGDNPVPGNSQPGVCLHRDVLQQTNQDPASATELAGIRTGGLSCLWCSQLCVG